jgi:hypothetical protein
MPQPECVWLVEAVWAALSTHGGDDGAFQTALLVPGSHHSRQPAPPPIDGSGAHGITVKVPPPCHQYPDRNSKPNRLRFTFLRTGPLNYVTEAGTTGLRAAVPWRPLGPP